MIKEFITVKEFIEEVYEIEGVIIGIQPMFDIKTGKEILLPNYPYDEKAPDDWTVDDLVNKRIRPILNQAIPYIRIPYTRI